MEIKKIKVIKYIIRHIIIFGIIYMAITGNMTIEIIGLGLALLISDNTKLYEEKEK